ncbi:hypothetical protein [Antarctobacter sp.]|uniref:hypothetical protein n=1 Tax=Antarctobacter sp. TaxID=1872577 RepID=UPI002B27B35D|nr:hypothetical protein [Antarctobacter sp.]
MHKRIDVGGALLDGQATLDVVNSATEKCVEKRAAAGLLDVQKALEAARDAAPRRDGLRHLSLNDNVGC